MALFLGQLLLLVWLQGVRVTPSPGADRILSVLSILFTLLGAFFASMFGDGEDHHYFVLMLPAIVLAAFRLGVPGTLLTVASASALTLWDVWRWFQIHPPLISSELFEAATMCLLYGVVGLVVHLQARDMRARGTYLAASLAQLERAQDALVAGEKLAAIGRLSSAIAHEIRNPVAMIHSSLAAAARGGLGDEARAQMFEVATQESERLERLTGDFLSYAHTRSPKLEDSEAASALSVVAELVRARAAEAGVVVRVEPGEAHGRFDPFMLHQALLNLALNAVQHTPRGRGVTLAARREGPAVVFSVINEGEAVPADVSPRIFEPFFTARTGGTGLGLAIARGIAQAHGGDAWLERNEPGDVRFSLRVAGLPGDGG